MLNLSLNWKYTAAHSVSAKDFMNRDIKYIWNGITYRELENILDENQDIRSYPLLDNPSWSKKNQISLSYFINLILFYPPFPLQSIWCYLGLFSESKWWDYSSTISEEIAAWKSQPKGVSMQNWSINYDLSFHDHELETSLPYREEKERKRAELLLLAAEPEPIPSPPIVQQLVEPVQTMQQESSMPTIRKVSRFQVITSPNTAISGVCESEQPVPGGAEPVTESLTATNPPLPCPVTQITVVSDDPIEVRNSWLATLNELYRDFNCISFLKRCRISTWNLNDL